MILLIDNFDSFVFNLSRYLRLLGQETVVVRNNAIDADAAVKMCPDAVVISPGPCTPRKAGCSLDVVRKLHKEIPILGVCLGHQVIAEALGGRVVRAAEPVHGRSSRIHHDGRGIFRALHHNFSARRPHDCKFSATAGLDRDGGLPGTITAGRYHSLVVEESTLPAELEISARADDGTIMALRHRRLPVVGVQFHPESILTEAGYAVLAGFLRLAGLESMEPVPTAASEFGLNEKDA